MDSVSFHENGEYQPTAHGREYRRLLAHYLNLMIPEDSRVIEIGCGQGELLALLKARNKVGVDPSNRQIEEARKNCPGATFHVATGESLELNETFDYILVSDTLNHTQDAQALLEAAKKLATTNTRLIISVYNTLWRPLLEAASVLGLRSPQPALNWLSHSDVSNLLELSGWETVKTQARILCPAEIPVVAPLLNRWVAPLVPPLCLSLFTMARVRNAGERRDMSVSVVIPARNESGNIAAAIARTPMMGSWTELIFVEGNSTDDTWDAICKVQKEHPEMRIKIARQPGKGKGDAVRVGFGLAEGDILMILDADLTMPPEDLPKFYRAVAEGSCEMANGCRLVYPMEDKAMRFLNLCANKLFGILFSWMLDQSVKDTLCGTKVLTRVDYEKLAANRAYFGDFDPFGDFDLLFGADKLNLKIRDIPVRYRERTYGETNIRRFRDGILLFRMVAFAATKLKFL